MSLLKFTKISKLLRNNKLRSKHKQELFQEIMLMVLSRVTRVDSNIESIEVEKVQEVLKAELGQDFSEGDILTAASSEIYQTQSLERHLSTATRKLDEQERIVILSSLASVIRSDDKVRDFEIDFFDTVALALRATPSEIAGLISE